MKRISYNYLLRSWILILLCCSLAGIVIDLLFSGSGYRKKIQPEMEYNSFEVDIDTGNDILKSAFDSIREMYLKSQELSPDSIINH